MKIAICDNDNNFINEIKKYIEEYFYTNHLECEADTYLDGKTLSDSDKKYDMAFVDIEMGTQNGIETVKLLQEKNSRLITFIVTGYIQYLDEAMRINVFRYLTKPLDKKRLFSNLDDAIEVYNSQNYKITIECNKDTYVINTEDIIMIEARNKKVFIITEDGEYSVGQSLNYWEEIINMGCFFRSHRSYIVNFRYVSKFDKYCIYLAKKKYKAYLTARKYKLFRDMFFAYLKIGR